MQWLKSSLQLQGIRFNLFLNYFLPTNEMDEKNYKTLNNFLKLVAFKN
jgi:hypothetical protein